MVQVGAKHLLAGGIEAVNINQSKRSYPPLKARPDPVNDVRHYPEQSESFRGSVG